MEMCPRSCEKELIFDSETETNIYMELIREVMGGTSNEERIKNHKLIQQKIGKNCSINDVIC